jgi:hypothetical protein
VNVGLARNLLLETLATRANAEVQLADVVLAELGAELGNYSFAALVSSMTRRAGSRA